MATQSNKTTTSKNTKNEKEKKHNDSFILHIYYQSINQSINQLHAMYH